MFGRNGGNGGHFFFLITTHTSSLARCLRITCVHSNEFLAFRFHQISASAHLHTYYIRCGVFQMIVSFNRSTYYRWSWPHSQTHTHTYKMPSVDEKTTNFHIASTWIDTQFSAYILLQHSDRLASRLISISMCLCVSVCGNLSFSLDPYGLQIVPAKYSHLRKTNIT